jgi:O-antigen/teichoic acid export membrane protein
MAAIVAPPALGASPWWFAAGVLAASVVQLAMTMVAARRAGLPDALTWPGRHLSAARGHVRFGLAASVSTAAELLEQQTDKLLLAGVSGFAPAGVFQAVGSLSVAVRQLGTLLHSYVYSFFVSNRRRDPGPLDHVTRVFTLLTLAAPAAVAAWLFVRAPSFLAWWIHVHDNDAVWGLRFLVAMVLVNLTLGPPVLRLLAAGSVDLVARAAFAALATNLVLSVAAVGPFGLPGVAAASLVGEVAQFAVLALHPASRRYLVAARPAVALVVAVVAAGVAAAALPTPRPSIPVDLATLAAPLGVAAAVLLAWAPRLRRTLAAYDWVL